MAVIITDNRTVVDQADSTTGWGGSNSPQVYTTQPSPVESTGCLGMDVSTTTDELYFTLGTSANLTDTLVYVWVLPNGALDTTVAGGVQIVLGDSTNRNGDHTGGSDFASFRHNSGPVAWQCLVIDTGNLPTNSTSFAGTPASITLSAITQIGSAFTTVSKAIGGLENCFTDIMFYGNNGLTITGGGTGTEGKFSEIAALDRTTSGHPGTGVASSTGGAYGICRELGTKLFGLQGPLFFGDAAGTGSLDFEDTDVSVVFENYGIGTNKYGITIQGNATGTTSFVLGTRTGAGTGSNGCSVVVPVGVGGYLTASNANIDTFGLYACTLNNFDQGVTFSSSSSSHEVFATSFVGCSQIGIGTIVFKNNIISNSTATGNTEAAVLMNSTSSVSDLTFISGGTGHAIEISSATANQEFSLINFEFQGYAGANGGTGNEAILNTSGQPIIINVTNASGFVSVDTTNSTGTVTIVNNVNVTIEILDASTTPIQSAVVAVYATSDSSEIFNNTTDSSGQVSFTTSGGTDLFIRVRKSTSGSTRYVPLETIASSGSGLFLTLTLQEDLIASV